VYRPATDASPGYARPYVPKAAQGLVATTIRTVFAEPDPARARVHWRHVADGFRDRFERLTTLMDDAGDDVLAYLAFPPEHWRQIWSNTPATTRTTHPQLHTQKDLTGRPAPW